MIFLTNYLIPIIVSVCALCALLLVLLIIIILKKKKPKIKVDESFIRTLTTALGEKGNISNVKMINGRLHFEVKDLDIVHLEDLKKLSTAGVFITNQTIKMLFSYDSEAICKALSKDNSI